MEEKISRPRNNDEIVEYIISLMKCIFDPEIPVNIFDLGLIYDIKLDKIDNYTYCTITMTLTSPGCPVADSLINQVEFFTKSVIEIDEVKVDIVFSPPWNPSMVSQEGRELLEVDGSIIPQY